MGENIDKYHDLLTMIGIDAIYSKQVDYFEVDTIVAKFYPGSVEMFAYFKIFKWSLWVTLVISVICVAIVWTLRIGQKFSLKTLAQNMANISMVLMSVSINKLSPHLLIGFWLITAVFVTQYFTAFLLDYMVWSIPLDKIEILDDIARRSNMTIITRDDSALVRFIQEKNTPSNLALRNQLDRYIHYKNDDVFDKLERGLTTGKVAFIHDYLILVFYLIELMKTSNLSMDSIYISKEMSYFEPYFLPLNEKSPPWLMPSLNKMQEIIFNILINL